MQRSSSLTVITILATIVCGIHYMISLTQQTNAPWLSMS